MQLTGPECRRVTEALLKAFDDLDDFDHMMKGCLDRRVSDYAPPKKRPLMIAAVVEGENARETLPELIRAGISARPASTALRAVAEEFGVIAGGALNRELEKIVDATRAFVDFNTWLAAAAAAENRICRLVCGEGPSAEPMGTGFLVSPSVVLTNWHVVEPVISGDIVAAQVRAQFDYYVLKDGSTSAGTFIPLAVEWLIAAEPLSPLDCVDHPIEKEVAAFELDYALLRLSEAVGHGPSGPAAKPEQVTTTRGWFDLTLSPQVVRTDDILCIVRRADEDCLGPAGGDWLQPLGATPPIPYEYLKRLVRLTRI
jgi:hypothetical protein